jgi:hypothetical protein
MKKILVIILFAKSLFSINIDLEIAKIQKANKEQRYILMNNLKRRLFQEKQTRRNFILKEMHKKRKHSKSKMPQHNTYMEKHKNMENRWHRQK